MAASAAVDRSTLRDGLEHHQGARQGQTESKRAPVPTDKSMPCAMAAVNTAGRL